MAQKSGLKKKGKKSPSVIKAPFPAPVDTEVEAYGFIRDQLRDFGWIVKDPSKSGDGQVWTQNQCLADPHMKAAFGKTRPENVVKLSEKFLWAIEAKSSRAELKKALGEATDFYCQKVNTTKGQFKAVLATGVAGNEAAGYLMRTAIWLDSQWRVVTINKQEATGFLSPDDVRALLKGGSSDIHEFPTDIVLDPACGTGGFLVAAFDHVRRIGTSAQLERFRKYNLFGIEQESYVAVLAIVNMIFRGDGKNNITEGNCFSQNIASRTASSS